MVPRQVTCGVTPDERQVGALPQDNGPREDVAERGIRGGRRWFTQGELHEVALPQCGLDEAEEAGTGGGIGHGGSMRESGCR